MAQFSQQEQNAMRREAARRAREMQKRVYFGKQQEPSPYADYPPEEPPQEKHRRRRLVCRCCGNLAQFRPQKGLLSGLDGDTMLILAMMVMLYKDGGWDGCDKKLLMALAYLLT